jgi:hypothetical protein
VAINSLQIPQIGTITPDITPTLANLVNTINQGQQRQTLADLGQGLANGTIDYKQAAGKLASTGDIASTLSLLKLGQEQEANKTLGALLAGSPQGTAQPVTGPTVPNDSNAIPGTVGMNQRLADLSQDFIQDNPGTSMTSGVRSTADQARLYADRGNNPNPVAPPGTSLHERGLAVDIGGMTPQQRSLLPQYGLAQPVANDPVHVELSNPPTGNVAVDGTNGLSREQLSALASNPTTRPLALAILKDRFTGNRFTQETDENGNIWNINKTTGQKTIALKATDEKNGGLMNVAAGGTVFDPKTRQAVFRNTTDATLTDAATNTMADQYLSGDKSVLQNLGRGAQGAANLVKLRNAIQERANARGMDGAAIAQSMISFVGDTSRERTAATQEGRMIPAGIEASGAIELGRKASAAVPRTNWVPVNKALQAYERGTSDPKLRAFGAANTTIINTYARAINPNGVGTVADKEHAREMLSTADGPDAYNAVLDQMQREIEMAHNAPSQARAGFQQQRAARVSGQSMPPPPKVGQLVQGYRYKGGDPGNPASWVKSQ